MGLRPQSSSLNFDPCGEPWSTVTAVRPTDTPGVPLALQPGGLRALPLTRAHSPPRGQLIPCCQAYGKLPCPGPRQDRRLGEPGGTAVREHRGGVQEMRSGHGSRSRSWAKVMEHGHRLDAWGCLGHTVPGQTESSLTLLLCYPSLTTGGLELRMTNKRKALDTCP